jgi:hypothetical protein
MSKKEVAQHLEKIHKDIEQVLLKMRLEWLNKVCREAKELDLNSLGELIAFIVNHASDIQLKEGRDSDGEQRTRLQEEKPVEAKQEES